MSLDRIRSDWTRLGEQDPLWAVLVSPEHRHGQWDVAEFFATGVAEVESALLVASGLGARPGTHRALDLGCGVGRLSLALAAHFEQVVGVDISPTMLTRARAFDSTGRCRFLLSEGSDLSMIEDASIDLAYSSLALQHVPPPYNEQLLGELMRVLRPGGLLVAQAAAAPDRSVKGRLFRYAPRRLLRAAQRRVLRYPAPMEMHALGGTDVLRIAAGHGVEVLAALDDQMYGGHWRYTRYFMVRR